jgi:hypothetical protein
MASSEPSPVGTARLERGETNGRKIDEGAPAKAKTINKD